MSGIMVGSCLSAIPTRPVLPSPQTKTAEIVHAEVKFANTASAYRTKCNASAYVALRKCPIPAS